MCVGEDDVGRGIFHGYTGSFSEVRVKLVIEGGIVL